jgi:hypothetical protein
LAVHLNGKPITDPIVVRTGSVEDANIIVLRKGRTFVGECAIRRILAKMKGSFARGCWADIVNQVIRVAFAVVTKIARPTEVLRCLDKGRNRRGLLENTCLKATKLCELSWFGMRPGDNVAV